MSHQIPCSDRNEQKYIMSSTKFHQVQVWTDDGSTWTTSVNPGCSEKEILDYFLGKEFEVASYPEEKLSRCVAVKIKFVVNSTSKSMQKRLRVLRGEGL